MDSTKTDAQPYLAHRALVGLTLAPPLVALLTSELGPTPTFSHFASCLVANWICTVLVGSAMHGVVNLAAPRIFAATHVRALAHAALVVVAGLSLVAGLLVLLPRLEWLGVAPQPLAPLLIRGLAIGAFYFLVGRTMAVLGGRAQREAGLARASEANALRARLATLQAQMNPHFLFNTLNTVASLIHDEPVRAEATIERLAGVLQYSLRSGKRTSVELGEELDAVRDYLGIEEARFGPGLRACVEVGDDFLSQAIPPMLLQPLVENAVLHGLAGRETGEIRITGRVDGATLVLTVCDDGVGPAKSTRSSGHRLGLSSVRERLELTYGAAAGFAVRERSGGGFECELRIPRA